MNPALESVTLILALMLQGVKNGNTVYDVDQHKLGSDVPSSGTAPPIGYWAHTGSLL